MSVPLDSTLRRLQAASGLVFGLFLALHLVNTWMAGISPALYDGVQRAIRPLYQSAVVEPVILAALLVHVGVGLLRKLLGRQPPGSARARWHRNAGVLVAVFVFGHVFAVRGASYLAGVYPEFAGLSFTLAHVPGYFYPYYLLFGAAALYHGLNGIGIAAARLGWRIGMRTGVLVGATAVGSALLLVALLGFGGLLYPIDDPYDNDYARLVLGIVGGEAP